MSEGIKRISIKLGYTTTTGARLTWDVASHRKKPDLAGNGFTSVEVSEPAKVIKASINELARISAISGADANDLITEINDAYKAVAEWRANLPKT